MTLPLKTTHYDDEQLVQYVLEQLPPEDTERLDEASIVDDELAARLRTVESDLVDAYARGTLRGDALIRFRSHYLQSPRRRAEATFGRQFVRAIDGAAIADEKARRETKRARVIWSLSIAAAVLAAVSGTLLWNNARLEYQLTAARADRSSLDRRVSDLQQQVRGLRAPRAADPVDPARASARPAAPSAATDQPIALVLLPQTRGVGPVPSLAVAPRASRVAFELRLESADGRRYQAGLRDAAINEIVWRSGWMAPTPLVNPPAVVVAVPAGLLKPQHYSLDLQAPTAGGGTHVVGSYAFEIVPR